MTLLLIFFLISIIFSFLCSIWEAVLLSVSPAFIEKLESENGTTASVLKGFKENIDRPLAAILTLNTIAHTVGAIGVGAQAGKIWGSSDWSIWGFGLNAEAVIATLMTLAILILSEIIPKTIGANNWQSLAGFTARSVKIIIYLLWPLVWLAQWITKSMKKDQSKSVFSRGDLSAMVSIGVKSGSITKGEFTLLQNTLKFRGIKAKEVMTPRTVLVSAPSDLSIQNFYDSALGQTFSRIPIFEQNIDNCSSYVLKYEVYDALIKGKGNEPLSSVGRALYYIEESETIAHALELMIEHKEHLLRVVGPFGGTQGILTMEDVIETLLGLEILDEVDQTANLQEFAKKKWEEQKNPADTSTN